MYFKSVPGYGPKNSITSVSVAKVQSGMAAVQSQQPTSPAMYSGEDVQASTATGSVSSSPATVTPSRIAVSSSRRQAIAVGGCDSDGNTDLDAALYGSPSEREMTHTRLQPLKQRDS